MLSTTDPSATTSPAWQPISDPGFNAPSTISVGGYTPGDYNTFIQGDPGYMALQQAVNASEGGWNAGMRGAVQKAVLNSGYAIPDSLGYLDAGQADQASQNPYSQAAMALQAHSSNLRNIQNALAARGGYDSGELTYGVGNEGQRFNVEDLGNRGKLEDYINGLVSQGSSMHADNLAKLASELGNATQRQFALHPGGTSTTATWDPLSSAYVDANGNQYDVTGKVLHGFSAGAPPVTMPPVTQSAYAPSYSSPAPYNDAVSGAGLSSPTTTQTPGAGVSFNYGTSTAPPSNLSKLLNLPV